MTRRKKRGEITKSRRVGSLCNKSQESNQAAHRICWQLRPSHRFRGREQCQTLMAVKKCCSQIASVCRTPLIICGFSAAAYAHQTPDFQPTLNQHCDSVRVFACVNFLLLWVSLCTGRFFFACYFPNIEM